MTRQQVSRWARRFVVTSASFLVLWQAALVVGVPRRTSVTLGLFGFVLHMVFGKAYSLVPSYFDRQLAVGWAPGVQYPLTTLGALGLAVAGVPGVPDVVGSLGAVLWTAGVVVFLGAVGWTIRDNPTGRETATGAANAEREPVDRVANGFVPVALVYLALGTYATLAGEVGLPVLVDGYRPRATHLLGAGTATLLVFALGFRLLPRFMVATPPRPLVYGVLPAGALAPLLLAVSLPTGTPFVAAAALQALAVVGYATTIGVLFHRSDRRRVGFYAVLVGALAGVLAVLLGLHFAASGPTTGLVTAHYRLTLLGFLGLTVVGVAFQFYPPAAAPGRTGSDRFALACIALLAGGLAIQVVSLAIPVPALEPVGAFASLLGALGYWWLLVSLFRSR